MYACVLLVWLGVKQRVTSFLCRLESQAKEGEKKLGGVFM